MLEEWLVPMRLLDLGAVSAQESQALYHALGESVSAGAPATLAILSPTDPYVCVGFHREIDQEVDQTTCRARGLPIYRRRVGGGTVYLDRAQVFFQLVLHERAVRMSVERTYAYLLQPAVEAYRALGVPAALRGVNDVAVEGRKLSGTGMARIGDAVVLVGNVIVDFDHAAMASVLKLPDPFARDWVTRSLRRWVTSVRAETGRTPGYEVVASALRTAFDRWLGEPLVPAALTRVEAQLVARVGRRLDSAAWLRRDGYARRGGTEAPAVRRVKIRAGRYDAFFDSSLGGRQMRGYLSADGGVVEAVRFVSDSTMPPPDRAALNHLEATLPGTPASPPALRQALNGRLGASAGEAEAFVALLAHAARADD